MRRQTRQQLATLGTTGSLQIQDDNGRVGTRMLSDARVASWHQHNRTAPVWDAAWSTMVQGWVRKWQTLVGLHI